MCQLLHFIRISNRLANLFFFVSIKDFGFSEFYRDAAGDPKPREEAELYNGTPGNVLITRLFSFLTLKYCICFFY